MKLTKTNSAILATALLALFVIGCNGDDNRVLTNDQAKQAQAANIKRIESLNIPEASKKEMESHMGGAAYSNPAADAAKSHGVSLPAGARQH